jgi:hypothetical protein
MSDDDLIRRSDARQAVIASTGAMDGVSNINALPAAPTFTAADLEAAFRVGVYKSAMAVAETEIGYYDGISGDWHPMAGPSIISAACATIRALTPPADLVDRVEGARIRAALTTQEPKP